MKRYDKQFKEEAVRLAQEIGTRRAAEQLGLSYHTLSGWRRDKQAHGAEAFVGSGKSYVSNQGMTVAARAKCNCDSRKMKLTTLY